MRRVSAFLLGSATLLFASGARAGEPTPSYDPRAAFAETDTNKDGAVDLEEFHARLVEVFYSADTNKDGFLSPDEYKSLALAEDFKTADSDGDGRISLHDYVRIRFHQFEEADTNHDGELSLDEVVTIYEGRTKQ